MSWAFSIASYEILTHRRRIMRRRESYDETLLTHMHDDASSQEEALMRREIVEALTVAVGALSEDDQRALDVLEHEGDDLRGPTMRKRRQRALGRLRDRWRSIHGEP